VCAGAISRARVERLVFAPKIRRVARSCTARFFRKSTRHHRPKVDRAGDAEAAGVLLKNFFRVLRN
jgi:tRNA(Arg) A34 adenosine deaminase TadA